ncbi:cilia- and flagella-associated protein 54-like isoform X3 [Anneissia japonica]|uniref:cilia- and flagella-associated protein 54-like isoform X3 n=1 Tax=Anneissia japonica TaxID=1529436 RepID=UPI0014256300|nr:cilia- and flagella-associated protein 54-like isoform X3 [Anneissia japonica]
MSANLKHKAVKSQKLPTSKFYDSKSNPVINAFNEEYKLFRQFIKRTPTALKSKHDGERKAEAQSTSRGSDSLFGLWNSFEKRLPKVFYQQKLIEMGDFLVSIKEYNLAVWQCYGRYLDEFGGQHIEDIVDVTSVKEIFFPDGLETEHASLTFRALYGKSICNYQLVLQSDSKLQNTESVCKCLKLLAFLRLITQIVLHREPLCWLVYNGTIHIYSVSRLMMTLGHSSKVLEYLLWACMCMENSVPLLTVRYLPWRTTLYTAVCQCYYDCKAGVQAESFARRSLAKVNELSQLEKISSSVCSPEIDTIFRQAAVKLGVMVYKRIVFDTRKRPKGLLRPKTRSNIKDAQSPTAEVRVMTIVASDGRLIWHKTSKQRLDDLFKKPGSLPWPRTSVEKLLADMFEGSSAQFLALLDTLSDSTRRTLLTSPPASDSEDYILDTFTEMFFAGMEIISGGGGKNPRTVPITINDVNLCGVVLDGSLMDMASRAEDGVTLTAVVKFVKWAYNYEQWEVYDLMMGLLQDKMRTLDIVKYTAELRGLEVIQCMEVLNFNRKSRKLTHTEENSTSDAPATHNLSAQVSQRTVSSSDEMVQLAEVLYSCIRDPMAENIDRDMMVDATLFLWSKCKAVFQKFQTGAADSGKYLQRMDQPGKWVHILNIIHEVMYWCGLNNIDPGVTAEVALRLALVLENNAAQESQETESEKQKRCENEANNAMSASSKSPTKSYVSDGHETVTLGGHVSTSLYTATILSQGEREQLLTAREILTRALQGMSLAREAVALTDGKSIADISWMKNKKTTNDDLENPEGVHNTLRDLHLELLFMYHRVCLKLAAMGPDPASLTQTRFKRSTNQKSQIESPGTFDELRVESMNELEAKCKKNSIYKALFFIQKSLQSFKKSGSNGKPKQFLQDAIALITKAQEEEYKLYKLNTSPKNTGNNTIPPPPVLLCRTDNSMVFKPGVFNPKEKVGWYSLFGCSAAGSNVKVRLNDYNLPGTGQQVPAYDCHLHVSGLVANEKYVFAVAAYTADGKLIGESIGQTSKPIMASHTMPILMSWAFLSQVAYQVSCYGISQQATGVLWDHFVAVPEPCESDVTTDCAQQDFQLTLRRLNTKTASVASPVLLRMFLTSIFIYVDVNTRAGAIYCDKLCDEGPYYKGQLLRLRECERMLVALELAGWLNESNLALQAVVQCYGLLAPIIHYKIPSVPVIQVLTFCHAVLQEIPSSLLMRRQQSVCDSLHHMVATITYHMAKVLRIWKQKPLANLIADTGKKMLAVEKDPEKSKTQETVVDFGDNVDDGGQAHRKKKVRRAGHMTFNVEGPQNEELRALEAHMLKLTKLAHSSNELTGSEDPNILHAFIATLPSRHSYKEVVKFRRRARYLEFFVQVMQKALSEGLVELATEWCDDTKLWLVRRNEQLSSAKMFLTKQQGVLTVAGDDPKKFAAAAMEFSKINKPHHKSPDGKSPRKKRKKFQLLVNLRSNSKLSETAKTTQEEKELRSFEILDRAFPEFYHSTKRRQRLRKVCSDELPWRCQLNILQGLCFFAQFLNKVEKRNKLIGPTSGDIYRSSYIDNEWVTFETSGTLVVGWDGGPSRAVTRQEQRRDGTKDPIMQQLKQIGIGKHELRAYNSAIEVAAAASIGKQLPQLPPPPSDKQSDSLPTYRSIDTEKVTKHAGHHQDYNAITLHALTSDLTKTFNNLKKAIVLAHRGQHWTLLQNASRAMWNCAHTSLLYCFANGHASGILSVEAMRSIVCQPFFVAADCILDMLAALQNNSNTKAKKNMKDMVNSDLMGNVTDEIGGTSLKFEKYLDDCSMVDKHWIRRMILRVLEMLYYEQQWEKLTDIAMRFNVLTNERYSEQIGPLICQAQQKLISRIKAYGGPEPPQSAFRLAAEANDVPITAKNYMNVQLISGHHERVSEPLEMGGRIDPEGHNVYGGACDAMKLVCVPLDVADSLQNFRQALDICYYTSRALQHSRKLLILYLAGQQICPNMGRQSRVDFSETDDKIQSDVPPDLRKSEFSNMTDIQTPALPKSQLAVVMSSYSKTIEMLLSRKHTDLAAQGSHELGNLHYHSGNIRAAFRWWSEALDLILKTTDTLHTWRKILGGSSEDDISSQLLQRCGMWGCLLGAILASKIAQYILTSDLGLRMESCFLSAFLFKAIFCTSLPHPTADRDYALYEIGEGCEVQYLVPGVDLLSDKFRCEGRTLVSCLRWVTEELFRGRHNLMVLPLLTLYNYFTTFICRDLQRTIDGRILKVRILTDLGLYTEALTVLNRILNGERLPQTADSNFRQVSAIVSSLKYNTDKPVTDPVNIKVLGTLVEKRLSPSLATMYGPHLTCHLSLAQAHLMIALANSIPVLPSKEEAIFPEAPNEGRKSSAAGSTVNKPQVSVASRKTDRDAKIIITPRLTIEDALAASVDDVSVESLNVKDNLGGFATGMSLPGLEKMKGVLLCTAERFLNILVDCMEEKGTATLHASELELVVLGKLELASVYCQYQLASKSASAVASAMLAIQTSVIFHQPTAKNTRNSLRRSSMKGSHQHVLEMSSQDFNYTDESQSQSSHFQYQNSQSRARLDGRLWLNSRLTLVKNLMTGVRGMGHISEDNSEKLDLSECREHCMQGLTEAEACGDIELQAEFLLQGALLDLQEGRALSDVKQTLKEVVDLLTGLQTLSPEASRLQCLARTHLIDLEALDIPEEVATTTLALQITLQSYCEVQDMLLQQMKYLGECVEIHNIQPALSSLTFPFHNIYLPHLLLLVKLKMRIGYTMARQASFSTEEESTMLWRLSADVLASALSLSRVCVRTNFTLQAEILLHFGKVEHQLFKAGLCSCRSVVDTLVQAISTSYTANHDLQLIKEAYLEMAEVYMKGSTVLNAVQDPDDVSTTSSVVSAKETKPSASTQKSSRKSGSKVVHQVLHLQREKKKEMHAAWMAVRAATSLAQAQRRLALLIGDSTLTTIQYKDTMKQAIPDFLKEDLMVIEQEIHGNSLDSKNVLDTLEEASQDNDDFRYPTKELQLTWIHLVTYTSILQRMCSMSAIGIKDILPDDTNTSDIGTSRNVVRLPLLADAAALRLQRMHNFLTNHLQVYASECSAIYPPSQLHLAPIEPAIQPAIPIRNILQNETTPVIKEPPKFNDKIPALTSDKQLCIQWYRSVFSSCLDSTGDILLLYAITTKQPKSSKITKQGCGKRVLPYAKVKILHNQLVELKQKAEMSLADKPKAADKPITPPTQGKPSSRKSKRTARITQLSAKVKRDENLEALLKQCMASVQNLFTNVNIQYSELEIPFEVTLSTIRSLEMMFDPLYGSDLTQPQLIDWVLPLFETSIPELPQ